MILTSCRRDLAIRCGRRSSAPPSEVVKHPAGPTPKTWYDQADDAHHHPSGMNRPAGASARRASTCWTK
jgi:hypothetical protein